MLRRTIAALAITLIAGQAIAQNGEEKSQLINVFGKNVTEKKAQPNEKQTEVKKEGKVAPVTTVAPTPKPVTAQPSVSATDSTAIPRKTDQSASPVLLFPDNENAILVANLRYSEAIRRLNDEIATLKRKKLSTSDAEFLLHYAKNGQAYLKGTDHVLIIDSLVVDKKNLLNHYNQNPELGSFYFLVDKDFTVCYQTERGNKVYTAVPDSDGVLRLTVYNNDKEGLSYPATLTGMDTEGDQNYPFMMPDGLTLYFSARSDEGLGNYDLYVTRLDDGNHFFKAENLGFPYNSYANDYLLVIDESFNIGMFASDRYQPADKVCLYYFVPNKSRQPYDYETDDHELICQASSLRSIATTQGNDQALKAGQRQLSKMRQSARQGQKRHDFEFVVNDNTVLYTLDDFKNANARKLAEQWLQKKKNLASLEQQLDDLRNEYHASNAQKRNELKAKIEGLESRIPQLRTEVHEAEKEVRKTIDH